MRPFVLTLAACLAPLICGTPRAGEDALSPPAGSNLVLEARGEGVQVYVCAKSGDRPQWALDGPSAALFNASGREIGIHGKGPVWTLADGSSITGETLARKDAPEPGAIAWLLLKTTAHSGEIGALTPVGAIRRIDTKGGLAPPAEECDEANLGVAARIRYSATYQFYAM